MKPLLIGIPSVLGLALVVLVVGMLLPTGGDSSPKDPPTTAATEGDDEQASDAPDRPDPELKGDGNPEKWARVLNELDNRRAKAFETLDKEALERVYAPRSSLIPRDRNFMDEIADPDDTDVAFVGARGVWTMLLSLQTVSVTDDRVELRVETKLVDTYYLVLPGGGTQRTDTGAERKESLIVLVPDGDGGWLIAKDEVISGG